MAPDPAAPSPPAPERGAADAAASSSWESRFRVMFERTADALMLLDGNSSLFLDCNQATAELFGCATTAELLALHPWQVSPPTQPDGRASDEKAAEMIATALRNGSHRFEWMHCSEHRAPFPVEVLLTPIVMGEQQLILCTLRDITHKKEAEELIWRQANFDSLTGLPNRYMLNDRLAQAIKAAGRNEHSVAVMVIDLDRFKEVNDTLGHSMGDQLLKEAAQRLAASVRAGDTVARLGGDEFIVILCDLSEPGHVERVARDILRKLAEPFQLRDEVAYVSASIGITLCPDDASDIEDLLKHADQAMYAAKKLGRNRHSYFTPSMQESARLRMRLIADLRAAVKEQQFRLHFQPVVEMATGRVVKAEALVRWQHAIRGLVPPGEFIALAEDSGLIHDIGDWVFAESAGWLQRWRARFEPGFRVSVNMSPMQFYQGAEGREPWLSQLRRLDLPGHSIVIEITESLLLDGNPALDETLLVFRDAGIQVAIDDFGTGYSSLAYVKKFDIDFLKIDQSFTRNLAPGTSDLALTEAIIVMAHKLGLKVIAEGVETAAQRDLLLAAGCDFAQGYLFSPPVPPEEFEAMLARQ